MSYLVFFYTGNLAEANHVIGEDKVILMKCHKYHNAVELVKVSKCLNLLLYGDLGPDTKKL